MHDWLDRHIEAQRGQRALIEEVSGLTFDQVCDVCEVPEEVISETLRELEEQDRG